MLFQPPDLDEDDHRVIAEIEGYRLNLRHALAQPRQWKGQLRRNLKARAIRGSNSIEGYDVTLDDAVALTEGDEPLDANRLTSMEIIGYRNALTYIHQLAEDTHFVFDESLLRGLHFMMLGHELSTSPGQYRHSQIYVHDEEQNEIVYEGPDHERVPDLMHELMADLRTPPDLPVFVRAALAHLNLVMIHPFRDGNGRMARALQTLVLAREQVVSPEFSSVEEWLGRNTHAYYGVLAEVGQGSWHPDNETRHWVRFHLTAHHMQAQTVLRRVTEAGEMWGELDLLIAREHLPERTGYALYDAMIGLKVRRAGYAREADLEPGTAMRDLRMLVAADLLSAVGETRGRVYVGTDTLRGIRNRVAAGRRPVVNPYTGRSDSQPEPHKLPSS